MKYTTVEVHGIIIAIGLITEIEGYTESILDTVLPDDEVLHNMSEKEEQDWVEQNNKRMESICDLMNKHEL